MKSIISAFDALALENKILIDARAGADARKRFDAGHVDGSFFIDLENELSQKEKNPALGGRHPLPSIRDFAAVLGKLGITPSSHVIVFDDKGGANAAARFWWMMRAVGHIKIQVVDGGMAALEESGAEIVSSASIPAPTANYPVSQWMLPMVDIDFVEQSSLQKNDYVIVDVREGFRYRGEREPIDLVAGHIPNAINIPFIENLNSDGKFKSADHLKGQYLELVGEHPEKFVFHCGSGVTACHTLLAMDHAGIPGSSLYVGSWSEWSRRDKPIAVGVKP